MEAEVQETKELIRPLVDIEQVRFQMELNIYFFLFERMHCMCTYSSTHSSPINIAFVEDDLNR